MSAITAVTVPSEIVMAARTIRDHRGEPCHGPYYGRNESREGRWQCILLLSSSFTGVQARGIGIRGMVTPVMIK